MRVLANIKVADVYKPASDLWNETLQESSRMEYKKALTAIERECIQRMMEMAKMGFAGTNEDVQGIIALFRCTSVILITEVSVFDPNAACRY